MYEITLVTVNKKLCTDDAMKILQRHIVLYKILLLRSYLGFFVGFDYKLELQVVKLLTVKPFLHNIHHYWGGVNQCDAPN